MIPTDAVDTHVLVDDAPIAILTTTAVGEIAHANRRFTALLGYDLADLVGRSIHELVCSDDRDIGVAERAALLAGAVDSYQVQQRLRLADGTLLWVRRSVSLSRVSETTEQQCIEWIDDISELKRLGHAVGERTKELTLLHALSRRLLRARGDRVQPLLQDLADWFIPAMQYPDITAARIRIGAIEAMSGAFSDTHPTLRAEWTSEDVHAGSVEVQYTQPVPAEDEGPFLKEERALIDSVADLLRVATLSIREAEQRDLAANALRASEARLQVAIEAAQMGTIEWDLPNGRAFISDVTRKIFGFPEGTDSVTILQFRERIHPDDQQMVRTHFRRELAGAPSTELEYRLVMPDGTMKWIMVRARVFFDDDQVAARRSGVVIDVTGRHALEDQFRHAQKMEAVGLLAGAVAHDFNNLLTVIGAASEFAQAEAPPESQLLADIRDISDAVVRARTLTKQLLTFSRRQVVHPRRVELTHVTLATEKMLRRLIDANITLQLHASSDALPVFADVGQLEQVLVNLVVNARDAMPHGGVITISTAEVVVDDAIAELRPELSPGRYALLTVGDTGAGMDEPTVERIFEPFFTTKESGHGTGLGLATVFGIIKQAGGHIFVYSEIGLGTTFRMYLPIHLSEGEFLEEAPPVAPLASVGDETILLVEDEPHVRLLARRILNEHGYVVIDAAAGGEALELARTYPDTIHLLLTDVVMPEFNGRELADMLALDRPGMHVLFMSGYTADALLHHRITESGAPFVEKPFTRSALAQAVRSAIDGKRVSGR